MQLRRFNNDPYKNDSQMLTHITEEASEPHIDNSTKEPTRRNTIDKWAHKKMTNGWSLGPSCLYVVPWPFGPMGLKGFTNGVVIDAFEGRLCSS